VPDNARVSLSKAQLASQAGADLLSLCQSVTSDGSLADAEVAELQIWLREHKETDLPAVAYLIPIVEAILQDGLVSEEEKRQLFVAIERVLPAEVRSVAKAARKSVEDVAKEGEKSVRGREREANRIAREKRRPIARFDFLVAGTRHEGRGKVIEKSVEEGNIVILERDRDNCHSNNAIAILTSKGAQIGFVPEDDARELAPLLDAGHRSEAAVKKILTGGRSPLPVVVVSIFPDIVDGPARRLQQGKRAGCFPVATFFFVTAIVGTKSIPWIFSA